MQQSSRVPLYFLATAMISLIFGMLFGLLGGLQYILPNFIKDVLPFSAVRPLHTLFVVTWIILAAIGGIYYYLINDKQLQFFSLKLVKWHYLLFLITGIGIIISYFGRHFEGREYLEFPSYFYFPIIAGWVLFAINYFKTTLISFKSWPVYYWMWGVGIVFMIYHFSEAHFWLLPWFRSHYLQNLALQWKSGGSYVGSWNMLVYGTSIYVMSKISGDGNYARSKKAFFFFFLGLTNLMFGWAHHVYIVPTAKWIRYVAYGISMTEWIVLFSIINDWRKSLSIKKKTEHSIAYQLMLRADFWVLLNIILALLISIPAINLFTHGTHITVAHSMGTTIGINTLILLSSASFIINERLPFSEHALRKTKMGIKVFNVSFLLFWTSLLFMGIRKAHWTFLEQGVVFGKFQIGQHVLHVFFFVFGLGILFGVGIIVSVFLKQILPSLRRSDPVF